MEPAKPYPLLIYVHLSERRPDAPLGTPHPKEEVQRKAREALKEKFHGFADIAADSGQAIPHEGVLTFVPVFEGVEFLQKQQTLLWEGTVREVTFDMKARPEMEGQTVRGRLRVFLGIILVAEISIAILVDTQKAREYGKDLFVPEPPIPPYRKIFASYSHDDEMIVVQFERLADALGDDYLRDVRDIRAGEEWNERIKELIRTAEIFQLFWSTNSMNSEFVELEWRYALSLGKPNFIRPLFWEEPMPKNEAKDLPPQALLDLQFKQVPTYDAELIEHERVAREEAESVKRRKQREEFLRDLAREQKQDVPRCEQMDRKQESYERERLEREEMEQFSREQLARDEVAREERERQQREQMERAERQARELEGRLARLPLDIPPAQSIPDTHNDVWRSSGAPVSYDFPPQPKSLPAQSWGAPKKSPLVWIIPVVLVLIILGAAVGIFLILYLFG